jgi:PAS domain S-box-containing protein
MVAGERGVLEDTSSSGQRVLAAFGPVPGLPWGILIQQPSDDAFAPLDEMDRNVMRLVGATMVLAIALGAMLALRIGRPLQRLRATAEAMASGDLDRRAELGRQDEAGELGRAFDHMADRLQASIRRANESEAGIRAVMDSVADAIVTFDENGSIDSCNLAAERLFGYAAGGLIGQSIGRLVPEADVNKNESTWFAKVLSGEAAVSAGHECEGRRQDGASLPLEFTATPLVEDQRVAGVVVAFRDVSARQRAEASLRESEERLRLALEIDGLGTFDWDIQHDRVVWSEDLERMFGVEPGTFGDTLAAFVAFIHKDDLPAVTLAIADSLERDMALRVEVRFCHIDGTERWIRASGKVFRDPEGRPVRLLGVTRDVTERKQAEQQREAIAKLEKLRALGQMASGIAHDLNQSLMLVASYSDLARKELVQDPPNLAEIEELLTTATQAALDGGETVKRLLLFTRSAPEQDSQVVDLSSVVRDAARLTAPRWRDAAQAEGRPISLHIEAEGHPTAQGSPAQLRELMTNLIFNAVDALPTGGTIRLRVMAEDGQGVIDVTDSGIGMSAEVQARVFEPFFTTKGEGGTGLGLAMVFGIVEQHGGHIKVRSAPGEGTAFRISFPLVNASRQAEPPPTLPVQSELLLPLRILVVDDEPMMTKAVFRMLKPSGHVVSAAGSGEEALQKLTEQSFDVVVSDMAMGPGMNGWELADAVRRAWPNVRFLLATGWGAAMDPREARTRGVEAVLSKPYQLADLLRVLARPDKAA